MTPWQANTLLGKIKITLPKSMVAILLFVLFTSPGNLNITISQQSKASHPWLPLPLCKRSSTASPLVNSIICVKKSFSTHSRRLLNCFHCPTCVLVSWNDDICSSFWELTLSASYSWSGLWHPTPLGPVAGVTASPEVLYPPLTQALSHKSVGSTASLQRACQSVCPSWSC